MITENASKTSSSSARPRPNAPQTDTTSRGGMIGTMKDPYSGAGTRTSTSSSASRKG